MGVRCAWTWTFLLTAQHSGAPFLISLCSSGSLCPWFSETVLLFVFMMSWCLVVVLSSHCCHLYLPFNFCSFYLPVSQRFFINIVVKVENCLQQKFCPQNPFKMPPGSCDIICVLIIPHSFSFALCCTSESMISAAMLCSEVNSIQYSRVWYKENMLKF